MPQKPSIPKGTRDFSPSEIAKRNYIFDTVKKHFQTFGYQPIETPSFENSETLLGKYGDEGDRLIFKILNSGDFISGSTDVIKKKTYLDSVYNVSFFLKFYDNFFENKNILSSKGEQVLYKLTNKDKGIIQTRMQSYLIANEIVIDDLKIQNGEKKLLKTLTKYGQDILIRYTFNIIGVFQESGKNELFWKNHLNNMKLELLNRYYSKVLSKEISEKALRYDLTVPFTRYVVMHQNEIDFPFKRYQIQPVWRADRPQKGRFREFFQCDADVVGSDSLLQEVELIQLYDAVFADLKLEGVTIKLNNRKILAGIAEVIGAKHLLIDFTVALDKLDKIGSEGVKKEMLAKGISEAAIKKAEPLFSLDGSNTDQLAVLENMLEHSEEGNKGVQELRFILETIATLGLQSAKLIIDVTLARGLNYYTGAILEVAAPEGVSMGSIGGGGRYDDLTGIFGLPNVSGVGISFGLDRIYLVLEELGLFPASIDKSLDVLCLNFGMKEGLAALKLTTVLRKAGIKADLYPSDAKIQKQFKYANNRNVPYVILLGAEELEKESFVVKNMASGKQKSYTLDAVGDFIESL